MGIPEQTVLDLLQREAVHHRDRKSLTRAVRRKLHNIMAPYLEDLNYTRAVGWVNALSPASSVEEMKGVCTRILEAHASTSERLPFLSGFYEKIFSVTGLPASILDLACGLHPFGFPWMGLPASCALYAFDIHAPRINLVNHFFDRIGLDPLAEVRDVLVSPPQIRADVAFLFKEAHRMEKRQPGCSRPLWEALQVRFLAVSLPAVDLSGDHDLSLKHRELVGRIIDGKPWKITEILFENELVFIMDKGFENEAQRGR